MAGLAGAPAGKGPAPAPKGIPPVQVPHSTPAPAHPAAPAPNPLAGLNVGGGMTGQQLYNAAAALSSTKYDPSISQLASEIAAQNATAANATKLTTGYFNGLNALGNQSVNAEGQNAANLNSTLGAMGSGLQNQLTGIGNNAESTLAAYTPGSSIAADAGATGQLATAIAEQKGLAAQQSAGMSSTGAEIENNWQQFANALKGSGSMLGKQELAAINTGEAAKVTPLNEKIGTLEGERQNYLLGEMNTLRNQEIKNQQGEQGLAIKQQTANTTAAHDTATEKIASQNANTAAQKAAWNQYYQGNLLGVTAKKLGVSIQNANTSAQKAQSTAAYQQGELRNTAARNAATAAYQRATAANNAAKTQVAEQNANTAASRAFATQKYDQAKVQQGWASLSEKQQAQASLNAYRQGELNLKAAAQGVGGKPLTTSQNNTMTLMLNEAANYLVRQGNPKLGTPQREALNRALAAGISESQPINTKNGIGHSSTRIPAINPTLITAAHDLIDHGTISAATAQAMKDMGMRGTTFNGQPIRIKG